MLAAVTTGDAPEGVDDGLGRDRDELRPAALAQLLWLRGAGELRTAHVRMAADVVGVHIRTVWSWLKQAEQTGSPEKPERRRFRVTEEVIEVLADYQGNVKRAHERLVELAVAAGEKPPGLTTLHDAIARDLDPGFMAGLREGIPAARGFDPCFQRPAVARNEVWEGDHKQAETVVMMPDGKPSRVWVTWFEDRGTGYVMGWAVTAGSAHRGSVLAAVRMSVLREGPYGPAGGLPHLVRVDGGADLSTDSRCGERTSSTSDLPSAPRGSAESPKEPPDGHRPPLCRPRQPPASGRRFHACPPYAALRSTGGGGQWGTRSEEAGFTWSHGVCVRYGEDADRAADGRGPRYPVSAGGGTVEGFDRPVGPGRPCGWPP